ncbi:hypothetical protein ACQCU1_12550 [Sutcliffiella horikoshii]|uniref:hypothetical protein n=1 Tax=Sutcliffiella horikoshii TaxID=79883 RepID=UPI003CE96E39
MQSRNQTLLESTYSLTHYTDIINVMLKFHSEHTGKWLAQQAGVKHYNLKKTKVSDVISKGEEGSFTIDKNFLRYVTQYKSGLIYLYVNIISEVKKSYSCNFTGRVKNEDSLLNKLQKKRAEQDGKFPINKVLNDLLGFRMIDNNYGHNVENLILYLEELKEKDKVRVIHKERINRDYRGYHVYLMGKDSSFFPIELQIWDMDNETINLDSHESYKKDYTDWPEIYYKG